MIYGVDKTIQKYYNCIVRRNILQVPIDATVRDKALGVAKKEGFSNLQDAVRYFLKKLADGKVKVSMEIIG